MQCGGALLLYRGAKQWNFLEKPRLSYESFWRHQSRPDNKSDDKIYLYKIEMGGEIATLSKSNANHLVTCS